MATAKTSTASKSAKSPNNNKSTKSNGLTSLIGKVTKAATRLVAPAAGVDAVSLLETDHDLVQEMFEKVKASPNRDHSSTFKRIKLELDTHAHIEETIFYPHLMKKGDKELKRIVREGVQEHMQAKTLLTSLARMQGKSENFKAKLKVLIENIEHHVSEEENEMFPLVRKQIPTEQLENLGRLMEEEKTAFKKRRAARAKAAKKRAASATA